MATLSRIEAICACKNIQKLTEENSDIPRDMAWGIKDRAQDMEEYMIKNSRYSNVTVKMDSAIHNMWNGLCKWDKDNVYLSDILDDLDSVEAEVLGLEASGEGAVVRGREEMSGNGEAEAEAEAETDAETDAEGAEADAESEREKLLRGLRERRLSMYTIWDVEKLTLYDLLRKTTSDRTRQLIVAAWYAGALRHVKE